MKFHPPDVTLPRVVPLLPQVRAHICRAQCSPGAACGPSWCPPGYTWWRRSGKRSRRSCCHCCIPTGTSWGSVQAHTCRTHLITHSCMPAPAHPPAQSHAQDRQEGAEFHTHPCRQFLGLHTQAKGRVRVAVCDSGRSTAETGYGEAIPSCGLWGNSGTRLAAQSLGFTCTVEDEMSRCMGERISGQMCRWIDSWLDG